MNSDKQTQSSQRGNVLIYVIIALALLGALTMLLAKQGGESDDLTYENTQLLVTKTVAYAASAKNAVDQMMMSGTNINNLNYLRPGMVGYDTAPHHNKVFHPDGGGLTLPAPDPNLFEAASPMTPAPGWYMGRFNNVEWTPTNANDVILVAYDINQAACAAINRSITGETTIPVVNAPSAGKLVSVADGSPANSNFTVANCSACNGHPSLCVVGDGNQHYAYYNIISGQ